MTNATAIRLLALDPRIQQALWPSAEFRDTPAFNRLMEAIALAEKPSALIMPLAALVMTVKDRAIDVKYLTVASHAIFLHPVFQQFMEENSAKPEEKTA